MGSINRIARVAGYNSSGPNPMKIDRFIRVAIAVTVLVAFIVATGALLFVTESALNVWDRLADGPAVLISPKKHRWTLPASRRLR